jgi:hypothetical protein
VGGLFRPDKGKIIWLVIGVAAATYAGIGRFLPKLHRGS